MNAFERVKSYTRDYWINQYHLTCYPAPDGKKAPFALICPGGGYVMCVGNGEGIPYAQKLNKAGYAAFVLRYRCRGKAYRPAPLEDVAIALRDIIDHADEYNVETGSYSLWGSSAGGHLIGSFGSEAHGWKHYGLPRPGALVLIYPVITMGELTHKGSRKYFLGKHPTAQDIADWSVENLVTPAYPPTFLWNSKTDSCVNPQNGELMAAALEKSGVEHRFIQYATGTHGCGLGRGTEVEPWFGEAVTFWETQLAKEGNHDC